MKMNKNPIYEDSHIELIMEKINVGEATSRKINGLQ